MSKFRSKYLSSEVNPEGRYLKYNCSANYYTTACGRIINLEDVTS